MENIGDIQKIGNKEIKLMEIEDLGKIYFRKLSSKQKCPCQDSCPFMTEYALISEKCLIKEGHNLFLPCALYQSCYNRSVKIIKKGFLQWRDYQRTNRFPKREIRKRR